MTIFFTILSIFGGVAILGNFIFLALDSYESWKAKEKLKMHSERMVLRNE